MEGSGWRVVGVQKRAQNTSDRYAVAVKKELSKVSRVCSLFLYGEVATIECTVTGRSKYSADLAQGGFEVPCSLLFKATLMEPIGSESHCLVQSI